MMTEPVQPLALWFMKARRLRLARRTNVVLVLLLAYWLAKLTWLFFPVVPDGVEILLPQESGPEPVVEQRVGDSRLIAAWHLLGVAGEAPAPVPVAEPELPETTLQLGLRGCYSMEIQAQALAIIADEQGEEWPYRIGDTLPGGAILVEIHADRVLLSRQGRREILRLPREDVDARSRKQGRLGGRERTLEPRDPQEVELMLDQYREFLENEPVEDDEH